MFNRWNLNISQYEYLEPTWFWALLLVPIVVGWLYFLDRRRGGDWKYNGTIQHLNGSKFNFLSLFRFCIVLLPAAALTLLIIAMAKPYSWQQSDQKHEENKYGIDIMIAIIFLVSAFSGRIKNKLFKGEDE